MEAAQIRSVTWITYIYEVPHDIFINLVVVS